MAISEFLEGMPCHDPKNFSLYNIENGPRSCQKRPSVYLPTLDIPTEQHIIMDKRCVLLRYLSQQWEKKQLPRKREHASSDSSGSSVSSNGNSNGPTSACKKRPRTDYIEIN